MRHAIRCLFALFVLLTGTGCRDDASRVSSVTRATGVASKNPAVEELIDQLQYISNTSEGANSLFGGSPFMAAEYASKIDQKWDQWTFNPTMRALVQMGVKALPTLIAHLSDDRSTKLFITHDSIMGAMSFSGEYSPRFEDPKKQPRIRFPAAMTGTFPQVLHKYTLRVGDLCFVAIGQIVNRTLLAVRYQPTMCIMLNSPVEVPSLADAVRKDWQGLTEEEHKAELENDAYVDHPFAHASALRRLLYYYPPEGERIALKLLQRRIFDPKKVRHFVDKLMLAINPVEWQVQLRLARKELGNETAALLDDWLYDSYVGRFSEENPSNRKRAKQILSALFPKHNPYKSTFHEAAWIVDQSRIIQGLKGVKNERISLQAHRVFEVGLKTQPESDDDKIDIDELALACFELVVGQGHDDEYLAYFARRVREGGPAYYAGDVRYHDMKRWIAKLKK